MNCAVCRHENPDGSAFCGECGAAFERRCPSCGIVCAPGLKFCRSCGTALAALAEPGRRPRAPQTPDDGVARKVITIVFADLIGSTSLHERLDPESVSRVMERYHSAVRGPVEAHGGTVVHLLGDGVMCAFGVPRVAEDDAIRAVRAAVGIQQAFRDFAREQREVLGTTGLRVAVNTGEVVVSDDYTAGIGDPLNVAARLQQEAQDGDVLIGESTERLVRELVMLAPFGVLSLKGRAETVTAYRVVSLDRPAGPSATAFVGRDGELRRLTAVYDAAVATPTARLAVILGSPGLGKSRLLDELARRLTGATVLIAYCEAAGSATFAPIARALRTYLRIDDGTAGGEVRGTIQAAIPGAGVEDARIIDGIAALLAGTPASPEETFFVIRRFLAALATTQPVVLAIDDLQWAEPLLLDLIEHLVQWSTDVPLLLLVAARPELREVRSSLAIPGGLVAEVVTLAGLDAGAATRLAANVIGADELPAAVAGRVLATSEGNPLFVGELVRMLVHDGALKREGERWTTAVELAALEMPPTIQALLAARIERLRPEERTVLERAAVVGRQFSRAAVTHLLPRDISDLDARLEALRRSELIEPDASWFLGEPALRFHHVLIRDAAYRRVLKGTRAELHARVADWLEARAGESVEHDETLGWHLEQAHQHLRELGPVDEKGKRLGERASTYLAAAGRRALGRDDLPLAASLLGRAIERLDLQDTARAELALDWCEALLAAGDVGPAAKAIAELGRFVDVGRDQWDTGDEQGGASADTRHPTPDPRLRAWHTCFAGQLAVLTDPQALHGTTTAVAAAADALAAAGDDAGEAKAHLVYAIALSRLGRIGACEAELDKALAAARRRVHDRRRANTVLANAPLAALWGPSPVTRASGRCLDVVRVLRITHGAPAVEAVALRCQAVLEALRGRGDAARRMIGSSRRMVEELGITQGLLETEMFAGLIGLIEGDTAAAEHGLRAAYEGLRTHGLGIDAARAAALLGRTLLAQGRAAEAEALSHESEALAGDDLQAAITWRRVRAEALARRGEHAAAVDLAVAAVTIATATDALLHHADARLALATALRAAGRSTEAAAEQARAAELWQAKGATVLAERARRGVALAQPVQPAPVERDERARRAPRRVRANTATAHVTQLSAAIAARDPDALAMLIADEAETIHHPTHSVYGRGGLLGVWRGTIEAPDGAQAFEPLATLGDSLALCRQCISASRAAGQKFDFGAYEIDLIALIEVDAQGRRRRTEIFAADRLGDAVARLYERYAELFPDGPDRLRAAVIARAVATLLGPPEHWPFAQDAEAWDHRIVGFGPLRGADALSRAIHTLMELSDDWHTCIDDVLDLKPDALCVRSTNSGILRAGGGSFERTLCQLFLYGTDGRPSRWEQFDAEQDVEALARFDELTAEPLALRPVRRVQANAATAQVARVDAAIAGRNEDALAMLFAEDLEVVDHTTGGASYDRSGTLDHYRRQLRTQHLTHRQEPLATLGDSLALCRLSVSGSGATGRTWDVGAFEGDNFGLVEVDAQGTVRRVEIFAADRLGNAIARLYERHAELLPYGPERTRAVATARSVVPVRERFDPDRYAAVFAPDIEAVDHRATIGWGSARGAEAFREVLRTQLEVAIDIAIRVDDIVALRSDAFLVRWTNFGKARVGGGDYERHFLILWAFGPDGFATHIELFDADRDAEALARFEALAAGPPLVRSDRRRVSANAATATLGPVEAMMAARDIDAYMRLTADDVAGVDHRNHVAIDRSVIAQTFRSYLAAENLRIAQEPLATLGDSLVLFRQTLSSSGTIRGSYDVGAYDREEVFLIEVDAAGRHRWIEVFPTDRLGDAVARLYARYAELLPEGAARDRAVATAGSVAALLGPKDSREERLRKPGGSLFASDVAARDHRTVGFGSLRGADAALRAIRALRQLSDDVDERIDDVLELSADALLARWTTSGTIRASGSAFAQDLCTLFVFGADGLVTHWEQFDADQVAHALARFDELTTARAAARPAHRRLKPNAATAHAARLSATIAARDAAALRTLIIADEAEVVHHPTHSIYDVREHLRIWQAMIEARDGALMFEPLATLGDSLALARQTISASRAAGKMFDVGPYEVDLTTLLEVDEKGRRRRSEHFAPHRLGDAVIRLYERYAELLPEGPERTRAAAAARSVALMHGSWGDFGHTRLFAPEVEVVDHRIMGTWSARGAKATVEHFRSVLALVDNAASSFDDVLGLRPDALLWRGTHAGTMRDGGGAYERPFLLLSVFAPDGLVARQEYFDADRDAEALARFDELVLSHGDELAVEAQVVRPARRGVRPNAATANGARIDAAIAARDAEALRALLADDGEVVDHTTGVRFDRQGQLTSFRALMRARDSASRHEPLATLGDALALCRVSWSAGGLTGGTFDVGAYEMESIYMLEVDARERRKRVERFAPDHLGDAVARLYERYAELLPDGPERERTAAIARAVTVWTGPLDLDRLVPSWAPSVECVDHRILGTWSARGAEENRQHWRAQFNVSDVNARDHEILALEPEAFLVRRTWFGTDRVGGGAFENVNLALFAFGAYGLLAKVEVFDPDLDNEALARFDELISAASAVRFENAAARASNRLAECWLSRDWKHFEQLLSPAFRFHDRRRMALLDLDRNEYVASVRTIGEMASISLELELVATRGERLALTRRRIEVAGGDVGPSEIPNLTVTETDERGDIVALVRFDPDDLDAAYTELDERYAAGEAAPYAATLEVVQRLQRGAAAGDLEALAAQWLAPDFVVEDHSPLGWGRLDRPAYLESVKALAALAPDFRLRTDHLWLCDRGSLGVAVVFGTHQGGAFEQPRVTVSEFDAQARARRRDVYTLDQFDQARARFEAIAAGSEAAAGDPLAALTKPNAATAARDRLEAAFAARDWAAVRALCVTDVTFEDRRRYTLVSMDLEGWIADRQRWVKSGVEQERRLVATAGDRVALERVSTISGPPGGRSEFEYLLLTEVDENGRILATVAFDPDDWRAAQREGLARVMARDPAAAAVVKPVAELIESLNDRDLARGRAVIAHDYVMEDRRRTGVGRLEGANWVDGITILLKLAPDVQFYAVHMLACDGHGFVGSGRLFGTLAEGGGAFEIYTINVFAVERGRITRYEVFEPEDVDAALARFAELGVGSEDEGRSA